MTPADLLKDLRDIHLPDTASAQSGYEFVFAAAFVPVLALLIILAAAYVRRNRWRGQGLARLRQIERIADPHERWTQLVGLLRRISPLAKPAPPPDCLFKPPDRIGPAEIDRLREHVRAALGR